MDRPTTGIPEEDAGAIPKGPGPQAALKDHALDTKCPSRVSTLIRSPEAR